MGCASSELAEPRPGTSLKAKDRHGKMRIDWSVEVEPQSSFRSMDCAPSDGGPPVAATHLRHLARLEKFLRGMDENAADLQGEVERRRVAAKSSSAWAKICIL
eukprot:CAMPEP_0181482570 /NCGR_PEP_ID=MMETSP1110-20121109/44932_1 /TAXON_ID=174948 /ORGANISM="Symbiodinium sp., Strain CCMP421" /LENGTH=102 /DNA_ID=CAMNT_0023608171 /DNA_START=40 /DNA_END=344 /DNA_ORIENTATION=+